MSDDSSSDFGPIFENLERSHSKSKKKKKTKSKKNYNRSKLSKFKYTFKYQSTCSSSSTSYSSSYTSTSTSSSETDYTDQKKYNNNKYFTSSTNSETGKNDQKKDSGYCGKKYQSNTNSSENVQNTNNTSYQMKKSKEIKKNVNYSLNTKNKNKPQKKRSNSKKNKFVDILTFKSGSIKPKKRKAKTEQPLFLSMPNQRKNKNIVKIKTINKRMSRSTSYDSNLKDEMDNESIINPKIHFVITAVSEAIERLVICEPQNCSLRTHRRYRIFDEIRNPIYSFKKTNIVSPSKHNIYRFISYIQNLLEIPPEAIILMLIYIERLIKYTEIKFKNPLRISDKTWRRIIIITLLLAYKIWEELAVWNVDYKYIFEDLTLDDINSLESTVLNYMNFKLSVNTPTYTNYYLELRNLSSFTILQSKKKTCKKLKKIANKKAMKQKWRDIIEQRNYFSSTEDLK
ncbi:cyclin y isoform a [Anaeramoeba flamelloides]|uniref:Cyclin y isoform a n=1 Tax=Anaeramoeba flamelloides TaxID=1746091 RepID=A0AAV8A8K1_9EUKA|nr:cyclin y isoform a [Anaeramoeba flamelloides]